VKVAGETRIDLPAGEVEAILGEPGRLARHLPGVSGYEDAGEGRWSCAQSIPLGLGDVRLRWAFERAGQGRVRGTGTGETLLVLLDAGFAIDERDGGSDVRWEADVRLLGASSALARKVAGPVLRQQVDHVLRAFGAEATPSGAA
jgi:carbon monoxide dehydrogenase subunit G